MDVGRSLVMVAIGVRHDASHVCFIYAHVGIGRRHNWRPGQALS